MSAMTEREAARRRGSPEMEREWRIEGAEWRSDLAMEWSSERRSE